MIDTHCHIDTEKFDDDRSEVLQRAFDSGMTNIIVPAIEPKTYDKLFEVVNAHPNLYCGMGIHPHNSDQGSKENLLLVEKLSHKQKVVAIGEIGLDYYYDFVPREQQQEVFRTMLQIAKSRKLPVIVHNRESDEDILRIIREEQDGNLQAVLHCFSSSPEVLHKALDLGLYVSFTGNITFKKSTLPEIVAAAPLDRIMIETDSPWMTPVPKRGKRNEPSYVKYIAEKIAEIKNITIDEVLEMTTKIAQAFFKLSTFFIVFMLALTGVFAQDEEEYFDDEAYYDYSEEEQEEELIHPFPKFIGFGPTVGINTIVSTEYTKLGDREVSYEGISALGGSLQYGPLDWLLFEFTYLYSKNNKIAEEQNFLIGPNTHQVFELTSKWVSNPYSRINIYGILGATMFLNTFDQGGTNELSASGFGLNTGLGMFINVINTDFGLFSIGMEWRLDFAFDRDESVIIDHYDEVTKLPVYEKVEVSNFFSIPRVSVFWFPNFSFE